MKCDYPTMITKKELFTTSRRAQMFPIYLASSGILVRIESFIELRENLPISQNPLIIQ